MVLPDVLSAPPGMCPVAPLREAFERSGMTTGELARALGWVGSNGSTDSGRVKRALGMTTNKGRAIEHIRSERASVLAEAIGVAPHEIGL